MNRLALVGGALLFTFGAIWRSVIYIGEWNCAHFFAVNSCVSTLLPTFFSYALMAIGLVLAGASFLSRRVSDVPTMDSNKNPERVP